jgi:hypothetical protein
VDVRRSPQGTYLCRAVPVSAVRRLVARWLRQRYARNVQLDAQGSLFFTLVDGQRTLRQIAAVMAGRGATAAEMERRVMLFVRELMQRDLLSLRVTEDNQFREAP